MRLPSTTQRGVPSSSLSPLRPGRWKTRHGCFGDAVEFPRWVVLTCSVVALVAPSWFAMAVIRKPLERTCVPLKGLPGLRQSLGAQ